MSDRFSRAKSRLLSHEQVIQREKNISKRLGRVLPEETVKVPRIGEWKLSDLPQPELAERARPRTAGARRVKGFPDIPLTPTQQKRMEKPEQELLPPEPKSVRRNPPPANPIYKIKAPKPISDSPRNPSPRVAFPSGTVTTDLDSIIRAKYRQAPKEIPPEERMLSKDDPRFMPLEVFDDSTYEEYPLEVLLTNPVAFSRYYELSGNTYWAECKVLDYDKETGLFSIEWQSSKKRKKVARFNLRFERENEELFNERVEAARRNCHRYETQVRFDARVQQMPTEGLPELARDDMNDILDRVNMKLTKDEKMVVNQLLDEVRHNFQYMNNQMTFLYDLKLNPLIPDRDDFLSLLPEPVPVPYSGLVDHVPTDINKLIKRVTKCHLMASANVLKGLVTIWGIFQDSRDSAFLSNGYPEELPLDEFSSRQFQQLDGTAKLFKGSIQDTLESVVGATLNEELHYNRLKEKAKYERMVILISRMLHTILLRIVDNTVDNYNGIFDKFLEKKLKNMYEPQFTVSLTFQENHLSFVPSIATFNEKILALLDHLETTIPQLPVVNLPTFEIAPDTVTFEDCVTVVKEHKEELGKVLSVLFQDLTDLLDQFKHLEPTLRLNPETYASEFDPDGTRSLDDYRKELMEFRRVAEVVATEMRAHYALNAFKVHCLNFKSSTTFQSQQLTLALLTHMRDFAISNLKNLQTEFNGITERLKIIPQTPEELAEMKEFMDKVVDTTTDRTNRINSVMEHFTFLEEFQFEITNEDCQEKYKTLQMPYKLSMMIEESDRTMQVERIRMIRELRANQRKLEQDTLELTELLPGFIAKYQDIEMAIEAAEQVNEINKKLEGLKAQQDLYMKHEKLFNFEQAPCRILGKLIEEFRPLYILWNLANEWYENSTRWMEQLFPSIRPDVLNNFILSATKRIARLKKDLQEHQTLIDKVLKPLSEQIDKFKQEMPLITKLRHPGIKTKHWEKISEIVGFPVVTGELTLQELLDMDLGRWSDQIGEIAAVAAQEYNIESSLDAMDNELNSKQLQTKEYKDTQQYILIEIDDVQSVVDDQIVTTQTLLTSPFIGPCKKRAVERLQFLRTCSETLEAWIECQRGWLYLQPVFTGTSIQQKLHREARDWKHVETSWTAIMTLTHNHPDFVNVMHRETLLKELKECNILLDSIIQGLNAYLEAKRLGFPRFFFLSNDELIAILSHVKDFDCIQKSMQKLFEYIATITVDDDLMITRMNDDGLESVEFINPVDGDTVEIEDWLNAFEEEMKNTIREKIRECIPANTQLTKEKWLSKFPAQVILITNQILWTEQVASALMSQKLRGLKVLQKKFIEGLDQLTSMIRKSLTPAIRQVVSCLLILEVHNRDIITDIVKEEVADIESFKWAQQLRYYWEDETVIVRSINNTYEYSYEYAGNSARLVITPLTDRCYQTLLSAFRQNLSGAPSGPAGTGKTETVRDCAKALGRSCVVYNCSEEVTPEQMSQFFAGLASSGSWSCFDEFNRINIEVLSVIAQQVRTIQEAIAGGVDTFVLDARTLKINPNAAVCITMNPGYAGRTELPDNLKALFRPCAMMVPDFGFIAEIMLFSGGFATASVLSAKLVALFDLCRKQLSNAHHYDWGLRAMKAILSTAGKSKRARLDEQEALLLVESIRDCTRPRLISDDVPLFEGIIHDVFSDVQCEKVLTDTLKNHLIRAFEALNAQPLPFYLLKCSEIYETTLVRHGIMFVGGAMGGKTTCWKALQRGLTTVAQEEQQGMPVYVEALNPKSVTIPELYGLFDPVTSGWSDGILSKNIRECSASDPVEYKWIVVDGPVDSLWIETMNSLLDDNKVLCLSNNERISLGSHVRLMFEVDDLSQASPATVSRCGMIFFDPSSLPWTALADSWVSWHDEEHLEMAKFVRGLMDLYIPQMMQFAEADAKLAIGSNPRFFVENATRLIECYMDIIRQPVKKPATDGEDAKDVDPLDQGPYLDMFNANGQDRFGYFEDENVRQVAFERIFIFSLVWSFGAVIADESRPLFDKVLKELMDKNGTKCPFPSKETVFDFFPDLSRDNWTPWCDGTTGVQLTSGNSIEQQLIPTNESASIIYLTRLLVTHEKHVLLHGPETSKTLSVNTLTGSILDKKYDCRVLPLANCSTSSNVLSVFRSFLHKRHGVFGPLNDQHLVIFLENMNSVKPEIYGAQPPLELIRQLFDMGGWYNTATCTFERVVETTMIAAMGMVGGGLFNISDRLLRHFFFIHVPKMKSTSLSQILTGLLSTRLTKYSPAIQEMNQSVVGSLIQFYESAVQNMLPVPSKLHYIFSLRNLVRVVKGLLLPLPSEMSSDTSFIKLFYHEMQREFFDRLNTPADRNWFGTVMNDVLSKNFRLTWDSLCPSGWVMFNDFADRSQSYKEVTMPPEQVLSVCQEMLEEHNREANKSLDIVLFREAVDHLSSLCRILCMKRGHAMLVGVKSSGRKSLARLALHMAGMELFEIQITRTYGPTEWREDMKNLMKLCGQNDLPTGFVLSDAQIIGSFQLEDISNLLVTGEIPNLYERDEMEQIKADIAQTEMLFDEDPWTLFRSRVKKHLHVVLVFSPYGTSFKDSMLAFPALRNETTIDWYMPWSNNALESVGKESLKKVPIDETVSIEAVVSVCVKIHKSVEEESAKFLAQTKRFTACTPSRYFELLNLFAERLKNQQNQTATNIQKYTNGVDQINETRKQIEELSQKLDRDIPVLQSKRQQVEEMLKDLRVKQGEVEETRVEITKQSEIAEKEAAAAKETNRIAQEKFDAAKPILLAAQDAVDSMDKDSLVNIKQLKKIHPALRETFEAICIIFERKPRRVEGDVPGQKVDDYWPESLQLLNDVQFIRKVKSYPVENMSKQTVEKLKKYVGANKQQREEKLLRVQNGYQAVANLYQWVCASYDYWFVYQEILPKKLEAEEAARKLAASEELLATRRAHLKSVEEQLEALLARVEEEKANEKMLADNVENTQVRLARAQKIISGLSGETKRWTECADNLKGGAQFLLGDSLLVAGCLTHLGAFSPHFRTTLLDKWKNFLTIEGIRHNKDFSVSNALGDDTTIRDWIVRGLPNDTHSIENALIIEESTRGYPLLIDPQLSGTKWLRSIEGESLTVLRFDQPDFIQRMRNCVAFGVHVLIENVGLRLDPLIEPILSKEIVMVDGLKKVAIGGEYVNYSDNFRLFLCTKYPNPHYSPEICSQVTLINFTTTQEGLADLLMNNLIEVERDDLSRKRISILEEKAENMKKLKIAEEDILHIVSNAGSDILDDDNAIHTLQRAQRTSADIAAQMAASESTEKQIAEFRNKFSTVADRAALLYFCSSDFAVIDPMYQFSLKWFVQLYKLAIEQCEHPKDQDKLIEVFKASIAEKFFESVSFSLFSRHKLLFSTLMATRILTDEHKITGSELAFLLQPNPVKQENPFSSWLSDEVWELVCALPMASPAFTGIVESLKTNESKWRMYSASNEPELETIPFEGPLTDFQKLLVLRTFHLHRVREGLRIFVSSSLGSKFVTPPPLNLGKVFQDSSPLAPLIFIITPGIDPLDEIIGVATSQSLEKYLKSYSLGRGRGDGAEELIKDASERGFWVLLQNCHLSLSWMPKLEHIIDNLDPAKVHERFRLCLVTMSSPEFPIGILYQGTKLIYEIPKGIRENMMRIYSGFNADEYDNESSLVEKQLTFHLSFFHSIVLERLQFGSIGWNIPYEFNPSDFAISRKHLKSFLSESQNGEVPFEALTYVIGELNYGGRVTDRWDRRLLLSLLQKYFSEEINNPAFTFGARYKAPDYNDPLVKIEALLNQWPIVTAGEDVGLSMNASTITARNDAMSIFNSMIEIQPTLIASSGAISEEEFALNFVEHLITEIPNQFNVFQFTKKFDLTETINTVLHHEIVLYNKLLSVIKDSLLVLAKGLKGLIVIDEELDTLNKRILANKVPEMWLKYSFPSVLSLRNYVEDLKVRVEFLSRWIQFGKPLTVRLGAFYHPEEFLTAVLQVYARKHAVSFDALRWETKVLEKEPSQEPEDGIYVEHLFIEGAKWDVFSKTLTECGQRELISTLPVVHLIPTERPPDAQKVEYECPMYRTQNRGTGALDLPNYLMSLGIPTNTQTPDHWIQRSVAVFITV